MKYLKPLVLESKNIGNLYHFTSFSGAIEILKSMYLKSSYISDYNTDYYLVDKYESYISFTRNPNLHNHLNLNQKKEGNIKFNVRLTFDGNKLSHKYKLKSYDDNYEHHRIYNKYDINKNKKNLIKRNTDIGDEMEERLYLNSNFLNIKDYLLKVDIYQITSPILEIENLCIKNNIPYKFHFIEEISEKNIWELKTDLKHFHKAMDLDISIKELMSSIDAIEMDLETIFPCFNGDENLKDLTKWKSFNDELEEYKLKLSELFDTNDLQTFSRLPLKWYWIYADDSTDLDTPIYILYKYLNGDKWSTIKLYYIQEDITNFLDTLSTVVIEFRLNDSDKRWFYKTTDSGVNWKLEKDLKKIKLNDKYVDVKSNDETASFRINLKWNDILNLSKRNDLELFIY